MAQCQHFREQATVRVNEKQRDVINRTCHGRWEAGKNVRRPTIAAAECHMNAWRALAAPCWGRAWPPGRMGRGEVRKRKSGREGEVAHGSVHTEGQAPRSQMDWGGRLCNRHVIKGLGAGDGVQEKVPADGSSTVCKRKRAYAIHEWDWFGKWQTDLPSGG